MAGKNSSDDLSQLDQLDNRTMLKVLKSRYIKDVIYTNCGDILIAVNPCKELTIFGEDEHEVYDWQIFSEVPPPHIFNTAARAFRRMRESETDQVIIVSGESGAGKTESTKYMVKHLVHMCKSENKELHEKIIEVNPLLESFGNAKTHMNHNSSRFAKYLELSFTEEWDLSGVIIRDYMLEKSRVVHRSMDEGNFHVFYALLHGASKDALHELSLHKHISAYRIMQSDANSLIAESRYKTMYEEQIKILQDIDTDPKVVDALLAVILHLTEIQFVESPTVAGAAELFDLEAVVFASDLLCIDAEELVEALVSTKITIRGDEIRRNKRPSQAEEGRDALAKIVYERTFQWLVRQINSDLHPSRKGFGQFLNIGILDIAGFEKLPVNSFEQLCINIVNERLQNFMNERLFKFEFQIYADEGIDIGDVTFENNDVLIALLTKQRNSVLSLLDEQSLLQQGSDISFVRQLTNTFKESNAYIPPIADRPEFNIRHFAGLVKYDADGFIEKNRDLLNPELKDCMKSSKDDFISDLFTVKRGPTGTISATVYNYAKSRREMGVRVLPPGAEKRQKQLDNLRKSVSTMYKKKMKAPQPPGLQNITPTKAHKTVVSHFKASLLQLLDKMSRAEHFFVRCLKPNEDLKRDNFTDHVVSDQLKYNGISEIANIRKMGLTYRRTYSEFVTRYKEAWPAIGQVDDNCYKSAATNIFQDESIPEELRKDYRLGKTKVFMKERLVIWMEGVLYDVHKKKEEEARRKRAEELKRKEEERKRKEEEDRKKKEEEERKRKEEEERLKREEEERQKRETEEQERKAEEEKRIREAEEAEKQAKEKELRRKHEEEKKEKKKEKPRVSFMESIKHSLKGSKSASQDDVGPKTEHQCTTVPASWKRGKQLGNGGFGVVFQVEDVESKTVQYAVKQITFCKTESNSSRKVIDTLKKDISLLSNLEHERIAKYYGYGEDNYVLSIFLEFATKGSVEDYLKENGALDDAYSFGLIHQILEGLVFIHGKKLVHRDLKASNVLLDTDLNVKICDTGLSTTLETGTFASRGCTTSVGASFWASPEVIKGDKYDTKTDIWSLGCIFIELSTGKRPWSPYPPFTALLRIGSGLSPIDEVSEQLIMTDNVRNFIDPLFQVNSKERPSAQELLNHAIFSQ